MSKISAVTLILSDSRGIYIPRDFLCDNYNEIAFDHCKAWGLTADNFHWWQDAADSENEGYWEAWEWILNNAEYTDDEGNKYCLHQDGDLWALCYGKMTQEERHNFGFDD